MKQEPPPSPPHNHRKKPVVFPANNFPKIFTYFVLLLSCYFLGYLSAPSNRAKPNSSIELIITPEDTKINTQLDHNLFSTHCVDPIAPQHVRQTILDRVFNGTSPWRNFPPPHVSQFLRPHRIKGWGSNGAVFENVIREVRPKTIIEVGTFLGASALHMAELTRKLGFNGTQILCIDDFRGWPGFRDKLKMKDMEMVNGDVLLMYQFMQNVAHMKATESVLFVPFSTSSVLDKLCQWGVFGDLIEVDAGHDFHSAWSDINKAYKILRPGGVIFGHDYFTSADNRGVRRAVNLFSRVNKLRVQLDGQHWVIHPATKN